jgi:uncharacterized protein YndB with AHSA1/START domain
MKPPAAEVSPEGDVIVECGLDAPPEKVWRALTVPELAADWLGAAPEEAGGERRTGMTLGMTPGMTYEIVEARPYSRLSYRWRDDADGREATLLTVELSPREAGGTWLRLTHAPARLSVRAVNGNSPPLALAA